MDSTTDNVKIHVQLHGASIDCEASAEFITDDLPGVLESLLDTLGSVADPKGLGKDGFAINSNSGPQLKLQMTTGTIAGRLSVKSGPELVMAAAAKLLLVDNRETFRRPELLAEMKSAPSYYKESFSKNLSALLSSLVKNDQLREVAKDTYAIEAETSQQFEQRLAS